MTEPFLDALAGGGELGERMRAIDWSQTALGPVSGWPQSLKTCIRIVLTSRQPMFVWWGEQLINLYNDPYKAIVRGKHPWALGKPAAVVWREIWPTIEPMPSQVQFVEFRHGRCRRVDAEFGQDIFQVLSMQHIQRREAPPSASHLLRGRLIPTLKAWSSSATRAPTSVSSVAMLATSEPLDAFMAARSSA